MTVQESNMRDSLIKSFSLSNTCFFRKSLDTYLKKIMRTENGFIGYQIPYTFANRTYWSDFSLIIPNRQSTRIECKSLINQSSTIIRATVKESEIVLGNMIENKLYLLVEGNGYECDEFRSLIKNRDSKLYIFTCINDLIQSLIKE